MKNVLNLLTILSLAGFLTFGCGTSRTSSDVAQAQNEEPAQSPIEQAVSSLKAFEGLFTVYQDTTDGSTKMLIKADQIGKEFIYWGHTVDGVVRAGHFRGNYRDNKIFSIQRYFDRIEFVVENTRFHFDEDNPLSRASEANISRAILVAEKVQEEDPESGDILINSDSIFLTENMHQVKPSPNPNVRPGQMFTLGNLSRDKNKFESIRSYPENLAVQVSYVFEQPYPMASGGTEVTDERSVTITYQHTFIEVPDNDFQPRYDDPRVGFFSQQIEDQTSVSPTPWADVINRWNLEKKDPTAPVSEPVEPIVWWIENTTPEEFRPTIKAATLAWNEAFEAAGFENAIQVKVQPDDAEWDAGDIRYNVLRWTSSPTPPFGGYGPSFVNPRTGQILGADIMLEYVFFRNAVRNEILFTDDVASSFLNMGVFDHQHEGESHGMFCSAGHFLHMNNMFGFASVQALDMDPLQEEKLVHDALYYLILHELGHTFGLNHNMRASTMLDNEEVHNRELTEQVGLAGSVMDYPAINVAPNPENQGQFYTTKPGPYDIWAIEFGYSPAVEDEEAEKARLNAILERSTEPELAFGNDADDMRSPGKAIDPRVMIGDMSSDPIAYAEDRVGLVKEMQDRLLERYSREGQSYQELYNAFMSTMGQHNQAMTVTSRHIGGVYVDRGFHGQTGQTEPYTPVAIEDQKRALASLSKNLFAPDAFDSSHEIYNHLQRQRRGFNFFPTTEDPKIHDTVLNMQRGVLAHVMHPVVLKRMTDTRLYGNTYPVADFLTELTDAIFRADLNGNVNTFRQNLQVEYVNRLAAMLASGQNRYDFVARSAALYNLERIKEQLGAKRRGNTETRAHTRHILLLIDKTLDA